MADARKGKGGTPDSAGYGGTGNAKYWVPVRDQASGKTGGAIDRTAPASNSAAKLRRQSACIFF
eukprot:CAMPEP_0114563972 /NCGR_PEP_ID=MMETSP0114-20121206/13431_1 /TAXON_ID=31324 /ORGANISM="Goniomonas sp, Strain m" /LENGTH=63 /DNA_ID=CAMNT_0001749927 /DNA_START=561 /DNA_END=749 /DNA_ORIENTATION=+